MFGNVAEYEALVTDLISALRMGIKKLRVQGDSKLVIQEINKEFTLRESAIASDRATMQRLVRFFSSIQFEHVPRSYNKHADALTTLASKVDVQS